MIQQLVAKLILKFLALLLALYTSTATPARTTTHDPTKYDIFLVRIVLNDLNQKLNEPPAAVHPPTRKPVKSRS